MNERIGPRSVLTTNPGHAVLAVLQQLTFWSAVLLPATYFPILFVADGTEQLPLLLTLIPLNVICLVFGHNHLTS